MPSIDEYRRQLGLDTPGTTLEKGSEFPNFGQMSEDPDYALRRAKASLFFDDDAKLEFLASQRFPNDPLAALRYKIVDGVIVYEATLIVYAVLKFISSGKKYALVISSSSSLCVLYLVSFTPASFSIVLSINKLVFCQLILSIRNVKNAVAFKNST